MILTNKEEIYERLNKCIKSWYFMSSITIYYQNKVLDSSILSFFLEERGIYIQTRAFILYGNVNFFVPKNNKIIISTYKKPLEGYITSYDETKDLYIISKCFSFKI